MPKREVDKRKTARALRKLRQAATRASEEGGAGLTNWEKDFVDGVTGRLEKYGSAFRDPGKGRLEEALSQRQAHVARAIDKKSRGKAAKASGKTSDGPERPKQGGLRRSEFKRKTPMGKRSGPRVRDVNEDLPPAPDIATCEAETTPEQKRAALRVVRGGKDNSRQG
ncbi:MAG TPA: hypothetical protein VFV70_06035 [Hyphomonadaceae bacterium]|nr:hypothetical protein [Hyphomonadaceae bacterium]